MSSTAIVIAALVGIIGIAAVLGYNTIVRAKVAVEAAWAQIEVQLKRRYDLVPNLVETVKGYATHEKSTFDAVTTARANAINASGPAASAAADNMLTGALKSLFAVSEAYPDLKASTNFLALQEELTSTENKVAFARQYYNDSARRLNTMLATFPLMLFKSVAAPAEFFSAPDDAAQAPTVSF
jgi:LemA protein